MSCAALECVTRLAAVRRSLFAAEAERAAFLSALLRGSADILRAKARPFAGARWPCLPASAARDDF